MKHIKKGATILKSDYKPELVMNNFSVKFYFKKRQDLV
jgi:hypothetical protein